MRQFTILFLFALLFFAKNNFHGFDSSKTIDSQNNMPPEDTNTTIVFTVDTIELGDIDGDEIGDTAFRFPPEFVNPYNPMESGCADSNCTVRIAFSCPLPDLFHEQNIGGTLYNIGNLDGDQYSELMVVPDWFTSCWGGFYVYSYRNTKWEQLGSATVYWCDSVDYMKRVEKIDNNSFYMISDDTWGENGMLQKKTKIKISK